MHPSICLYYNCGQTFGFETSHDIMVTMVIRKAPPPQKKRRYFEPKNLGVTDLKLAMHILLHSGSKMSWVPAGCMSSFPCVRLKIIKIVFQQKKLNLGSLTHDPIYIFGIKIIWGIYSVHLIFSLMPGLKKGQK